MHSCNNEYYCIESDDYNFQTLKTDYNNLVCSYKKIGYSARNSFTIQVKKQIPRQMYSLYLSKGSCEMGGCLILNALQIEINMSSCIISCNAHPYLYAY